MRFALTLAATVLALPAAAEFTPLKPGTTFVYAVDEGGDQPTITRSLTVLLSNSKGYVATDNDGAMIRNYYGFVETHCDVPPSFNPADLAKGYPLTPGTELADGFVFVIGQDQPFWMEGKTFDTWAVREWTEHGSTWVTRVSTEIGAPLDGLLKVEERAVPEFDAAEAQTCLEY